jgi:PASTA domain
MDSVIDWIIETVFDVLGDLGFDWTGRGRRRRRIGPPWTTVPELRDLSMAEAKDALARAGLRMTVVCEAARADVTAGRVVSQDPPAWRAARRRHRVTVCIAAEDRRPGPAD